MKFSFTERYSLFYGVRVTRRQLVLQFYPPLYRGVKRKTGLERNSVTLKGPEYAA